jgi:hypothetical protein
MPASSQGAAAAGSRGETVRAVMRTIWRAVLILEKVVGWIEMDGREMSQ